MPSDDTTVATQANFVPMAVGNTDRDRSFQRGRKLMWNAFNEHVQPVGNFGQVVLR